MTPEKSDQSPIDPAELEMHARVEIGLIDAFPGYDAMKPPVPVRRSNSLSAATKASSRPGSPAAFRGVQSR